MPLASWWWTWLKKKNNWYFFFLASEFSLFYLKNWYFSCLTGIFFFLLLFTPFSKWHYCMFKMRIYLTLSQLQLVVAPAQWEDPISLCFKISVCTKNLSLYWSVGSSDVRQALRLMSDFKVKNNHELVFFFVHCSWSFRYSYLKQASSITSEC